VFHISIWGAWSFVWWVKHIKALRGDRLITGYTKQRYGMPHAKKKAKTVDIRKKC